MVDETHKPRTITRGPESRSGAALNHSDQAMLMQSLQSLRERVLERLDSLETLARNQSACTPARGTSADQERVVELKAAELAETERKLQDQAERQEKEWSASLIQLESDRRLLAEAWEHVERERIAYASVSELHPNSRAQSQGQQQSAPANPPRAGALLTARSNAADSDSNHPVTQAILRQFQTLSSDVRRNTQSAEPLVQKEGGQNRESPAPTVRPRNAGRGSNGRLRRD